MNKKIIAPAVVLSTALSTGSALAQSFDGSFSKRVYIGIGGGPSTLDPDTSGVDGLDLLDDSDTAVNVMLGFDFSRRFTAELQYIDLGTAELSGGDGIEYRSGSLTGLVYLLNFFGESEFLDRDGLDRRAGLSLYGRLGVGAIDNDSVGSVLFERSDDAQLVAGLGVEYALPSGFGVRAEFISYDDDASYGGLSLLYRFGGSANDKPQPAIVVSDVDASKVPKQTDPALLPPSPRGDVVLPPVFATIAAGNGDGDSDGVRDEIDECPVTAAGTPVNKSGCATFGGALEGVNFLVGSDTLAPTSRDALDQVVATMTEFPDVRVSVQAHTDNQGLEETNFQLSRGRAIAVVRYLTSRGIPVERFEARAFGASLPIADNSTPAGRLLNRRVELVVIPN